MANEESLERRISNDFDKAFDQLLQIESANHAKIPEELFRGIFLGLFANSDEQHPDATIQNWIAIAGSPFHSVDVYSGNEKIFTVPPIYSKDAIQPSEMNRSEPLSHIVSVAEKLSMRSPREGQNYIDNKYAAVSRKVRGSVDRIAYAKEWNAIFARYGLPEIVSLAELPNQPETKASSDIKDELRGDDLDFTPI